MASNNNDGISPSIPSFPILKRKGYEACNTKIKTLFIYQDLWELVEKGYTEEGVSGQVLEDHRKIYAKAFSLFCKLLMKQYFHALK